MPPRPVQPRAQRLPEARALLDALPEPAVLLGLDYRILAANRAYRERYGEVPAGACCYQVSHRYAQPCDQAGESCPLQASLAADQPRRVLHLHYTRHGEEHVDVETFPVREEGRVVAVLEVLHHGTVGAARPQGGPLLGRSPPFNRMLGLIERVAPSEVPVLLLGESGTGKELAARAVHQASRRAQGPFVPLDCSGLSETLFESELFGHEKGAFTGALGRKTGLVEAAAGGTLFLDEVGDIPLGLQVKLLRLLETGTFRRVGSVEVRKADFRLVCATHRDLEALVREGAFRQDLYYRISAFPIRLPPLRERREDLPLLAEAFLARLSRPPKRLSPEALACLQDHPFPGNVRELRNLLERAVLLADGPEIGPEHLACCAEPGSEAAGRLRFVGPLRPLAEVERDYLRWAAAVHRGDRRSLARRLGLSERTLYRKLRGR